ncbi:hypothetical protein [Streptomyces sp. NPDC048442]|uniref:hypothetical protein n=1 Tax=Streptomyces sp. NPDC048442 TaxID=3154823 RepID=UPI0034137CEA
MSLLYQWRILPLTPAPGHPRPSNCPTTAPADEGTRGFAGDSVNGGCSCVTAAAPPVRTPWRSSRTGRFSRRDIRAPVP